MIGFDSGMAKKGNDVIATRILHSKQIDFTIQVYCNSWNSSVFIDWGDSTSHIPISTAAITHTYPSVGTWEVKIMGAIDNVTAIICNQQTVTDIIIHPFMYKLNQLKAYGNNLTSIDFTNCPAISVIYLYDNVALTSIVLPTTEASSGMLAWDVRIYNTAITSFTVPLTVRGITNFQSYNCKYLAYIDISAGCNDGLKGINELRVYDCPLLTTLLLGNPKYFNSFFVYNNPKLTTCTSLGLVRSSMYLQYYSNPLIEEIDTRSLVSVTALSFQNDTALTSVNLNNLTSASMQLYICSCPNLTSLSLPNLTSTGTLYLSGNSSLTSLTLNDNLRCTGIYLSYAKMPSFKVPSAITTLSALDLNYFEGESIDFNNLIAVTGTLTISGGKIELYNISAITLQTLQCGNHSVVQSLIVGALTYSIYVTNCSQINNLQFTKVSTLTYLTLSNCPALSYIDISKITAPNITIQRMVNPSILLSGTDTYTNIYINQNYGIASMPSLSHIRSVTQIDIRQNGLTQAQVDAVYNQCLEISIYDTSVKLYIQGTGYSYGTINAQPSAQGLADKATLISRGWTVN